MSPCRPNLSCRHVAQPVMSPFKQRARGRTRQQNETATQQLSPIQDARRQSQRRAPQRQSQQDNEVINAEDVSTVVPPPRIHIAPYTDQQSVIRGCRSVLDGGCLSENMLNTHGMYPGFTEQLRVLGMPGSQLFLKRLEVTDKKLLTQLLQSLCLRGMRWNVMVEVLASESFHGYPLVQQVCTQLTQLSTPPRRKANVSSMENEGSRASTTVPFDSPLKALRNMLSNPNSCATNEPHLTNVDRRLSKTKRKAARQQAQREKARREQSTTPKRSQERRDNVRLRRPKRSSKFHVASSCRLQIFRVFHVDPCMLTGRIPNRGDRDEGETDDTKGMLATFHIAHFHVARAPIFMSPCRHFNQAPASARSPNQRARSPNQSARSQTAR